MFLTDVQKCPKTMEIPTNWSACTVRNLGELNDEFVAEATKLDLNITSFGPDLLHLSKGGNKTIDEATFRNLLLQFIAKKSDMDFTFDETIPEKLLKILMEGIRLLLSKIK